MRFNIRSLLIVTVYVAVGCAALVQATETWASIVVTLTVATLLAAAVAGVLGHGGSRALSCGLALVGVGYLAVIFTPGVSVSLGPRLATTKALQWAFDKVHDEDAAAMSVSFSPSGRWLATGPAAPAVRLWDLAAASPQQAIQLGAVSFFAIGHCMWALTLGCLGGLLGQFCYARSQRRTASSSPIASPVE